VAALLLAEPEVRLFGLDAAAPEEQPPGLTYVQADVHRRDLPEILAEAEVTTICHLAFRQEDVSSAELFDYNVMGAINVLGAAAKAGVRRLVTLSSAGVYGVMADNSARLTEEASLRGSPEVPTLRCQVELEQFYRQYRHTAPEAQLTVLRPAHIVGPTVDSPMTRYLADPWTPVLLGVDPLLQFIHEDDVAAALVRAILSDVDGPVNVAARPAVRLSGALALVRKLPLAVPVRLASWGQALLAERGKPLPLPLEALRYSALVDTKRMEQALAFRPARTAIGALHDFAEAQERPLAGFLRERLAGRLPLRRR
jgi:UDP-glucose 4-epimerase